MTAGDSSVELDPWQPRHEMTGRRLVTSDRVLSTLFWPRKTHAQRLLQQALAVDWRYGADRGTVEGC